MVANKPRIVAVPLVAVGHVTPMMHLCSYLSKHGFSITFVMVSGLLPLKDIITTRGTWPPPGSDITLVELTTNSTGMVALSEAFSNGKVNLTYVHSVSRNNAPELEKLVSEMDGGVSLILCEYQYSWAVDVAEKLHIPAAVLFTGSSTWSWFELNMPFLIFENLIPSIDELLPEDEDSIICSDPLLQRSDIPWHFWGTGKDFQAFTLKYNVGVWEKAAWVLVNTCEALEKRMVEVMQARLGSKYLPIGPLCLANEERNSVGVNHVNRDSIISWLNKQDDSSVLYIAFGSLASLTNEQRKEFALGLLASQQKFLWVDQSIKENSGFYRMLLDTGRGMVVSWTPQLEVLSHRATGAFLTHCGWNSTIEGISNGQPMICWPCLFEQNLNSKLIVEEWKVGIRLTKMGGTRVVKRDEVERVVRTVMDSKEGEEMRSVAKELSLRISKSPSQLDVCLHHFKNL